MVMPPWPDACLPLAVPSSVQAAVIAAGESRAHALPGGQAESLQRRPSASKLKLESGSGGGVVKGIGGGSSSSIPGMVVVPMVIPVVTAK